MRVDLAAMAKRTGTRRKRIPLRTIAPTASLAADLAAIYLMVVRAWQEQQAPILAEYSRTLAAITTDSPADIDRTIGIGELTLTRLLLTLEPRLRDWVLRVERWQRGKFIGNILSATSIDLTTILSPDDVTETVEAVTARNVSLIRNVSDEARARFSDIVFRGVNQRTPTREVAKEMAEAIGLSRKRALRIASHQTNALTSRLDQARQEQVGIGRYTWRHSGKRFPRAEHQAREGKVFAWKKPPADGHPGTLPFCGCRAQAYIDLEDED